MEIKFKFRIASILIAVIMAFGLVFTSLSGFFSRSPKTASAAVDPGVSLTLSYDQSNNRLSWNTVGGVTQYRIHKDFMGYAYVTGTSYTPTETGTYSVSCKSGGIMSNLVDITSISAQLIAPTLTFDENDRDIVWNYPEGTTYIESVQVDYPGGSTTVSTSYSRFACPSSGTYSVRFIPKANSGYRASEYATISVTLPALTLSAPSVRYDSDSHILSWSAIDGAVSYEVRRDSSSEYVTVSTTSYTVEVSDYYSVRAVGDGTTTLTSAWSNIVLCEIPSSAITLPAPVVAYDSSAHVLSWSAVNPTPVRFEVLIGSTGEIIPVDGRTYTVTSSDDYSVRAVGDGTTTLTSVWSAPVTVDLSVPVEPDPDPDPPAAEKLLAPVLSYATAANELRWTNPNDPANVKMVAVVHPSGKVSMYPPKITSVNVTEEGNYYVYFVGRSDLGFSNSDYSNVVDVKFPDVVFDPFETIFHACDAFFSIKLFGNDFTLGGVMGIAFGFLLLGLIVKLLMG